MRLTESKRSEILAKLLKRKFDAAESKIVEARTALAVEVYNTWFPEDQRKLMADLPDGWLFEGNEIRARFGLSTVYMLLPRAERFPHVHRGDIKSFDARHRLSQRWQMIYASEEKLREEKNSLRAQLRAILNSVSTENKLVEVWPEAKPFLSPGSVPKANLPAVDIRALNKALGLPDKAKAA